MRFQNHTLGFVKDLYLLKIAATLNNDHASLEYLKENFPELFDAKFLIDLLRNTLRLEKGEISEDMKFEYLNFKTH